MFSPLIGHAGGFSWDEALLVLTPIAIVAGVLFLANQRAKRFSEDLSDEAPVVEEAAADRAASASGPLGDDPPATRP